MGSCRRQGTSYLLGVGEVLKIKNRRSFRFTRRWFERRNMSTFGKYVWPRWNGKPDLLYLEIGVFEGMSMVWMMQHILTGKGSWAIGIDSWAETRKISQSQMRDIRYRAYENLLTFDSLSLYHGESQNVIPELSQEGGVLSPSRNLVDIALIDGAHEADSVLRDAELVLPLLRKGGWMLFDDVENDYPKEGHVKEGLHRFLSYRGDLVKRVFKDRYAEGYEKL